MSIRVTCFVIIALFLFFYAWKDWFKSLCGLIVLMAFLEHPDMPSKLLGIQGMNLWNLLMISVLLGWFVQRRYEGCALDMPKGVNILLVIYFLIILISFLRMIADRDNIPWVGTPKLISSYLINTFKWVIPGLLLFYGCRSRERAKIAFIAILLFGFFLAVQVTRMIPPGYVFAGTDAHRRLKLNREMGFNAVDLSVILAGMSWAMVATVAFFKKRGTKLLILLIVGFVSYAQALTGGRGGFVAWGLTGLSLCLLKWRKYLILAPVVVMLLPIVFPGVASRMLVGFGTSDMSGESTIDTYQITSGRMQIWPYVIDKIRESPIIGYGQLAMIREQVTRQIRSELKDSFPHPHNAYLEWLLDNGLVGFIPVMTFYIVIIIYATKLFRDRTDPLYSATGGMTLSIVMAQLIGSMGAQTFYPREGTVVMWCAIGLTLRMTVERSKVNAAVLNQNYQDYPLPALSQTALYSNPQ
ncbi:MAG: O-antigen ligase family protein [Planctomycetes bacterium]|nr:O-antigen ligase family protein [Planctomycetota bacterium]